MASSRKSPKNSTLLARVSAALERHVGRGDRLVVGLSGGVDSVVLLDLLRRAARKLHFELAALHVNHQINPAAREWARFCRALCRRHHIPLSVRTVEVPRGNSLEAAARTARYKEYATARCHAVVLAHNLDDQAETVLLQLLRGAGVKGASAMPEFRERAAGNARGKTLPSILRPLLEVPRSEIEAYARARKLAWVEDDSNRDTAFDRNFMRHTVLPLIAQRYPAYRQTLLRASRNFAEASQLADACAAADAGEGEATLDIRRLQGLPLPRVKNALRHFLGRRGVVMPNARRLEECARQVMHARPGARLALRLGEYELRCHADALHVVQAVAPPSRAFEKKWRGEKQWRLPEFGGVLVLTRRRGKGIGADKLAADEVTVRGRRGGERLRPDAARPRRTLKNLLQERRMPEWQRQRLPLLYVGDALAYVAGIGIDANFQAAPDESGLVPEWQFDTR